MINRKTVYLLFVAGFAAFFLNFSCSPVLAATDVYDPKGNPSESLTEYHERNLIGGPNDAKKLSKDVYKLLDLKINPESRVRIANGSKSLAMIAEAARKRWPNESDESASGRIIDVTSKAAELFIKGTPGDYGKTTKWDIDSEDLVWAPIKGGEVRFVDDFLKDKCGDPNSTDCKAAFKDAVDALRLAELGHRCVAYMAQGQAISSAFNYYQKRTLQWDTYFNEGIPQWPWELALVNGPIYGLMMRDVTGAVPPPTFQVIFAHPDLALEYMPKANDGEQFEPVLMVEVIGIDIWSWKDDGSQGGPLFGYPVGLGVIGTYADRASEDDWGWGGIIHINHTFNLGVTFRNGDPGYFLSVNAAMLFRNIKDQKKKLKQKLKF